MQLPSSASTMNIPIKESAPQILTATSIAHVLKFFFIAQNPGVKRRWRRTSLSSESVYLYPSLCLFEGTDLGVGRRTKQPFQIYTHPQLDTVNLVEYAHSFENNEKKLNLSWILEARKQLKDDEKFFNNYFIKLVGVSDMQQKIDSGMTEDEIRSSWQTGIDNYLKIREKYLTY